MVKNLQTGKQINSWKKTPPPPTGRQQETRNENNKIKNTQLNKNRRDEEVNGVSSTLVKPTKSTVTPAKAATVN